MRLRTIAVFFIFSVVVSLSSALWQPVSAADLYTVQHVKVDETDESAAKAKIKAITLGQKKAFDTLLSRLVREEYRVQIPEFDNSAISRYFAGLSVEEEKTGPKRYIARLTYRFKTKEVRDMLLSYGVPFQENRAASVLILPVWLEGGKKILFEDKNPWRDAWLKVDSSNSLTPILVPLGDQNDRDAVSADAALKLNQSQFERLKERYQVSHVVVAAARPNRAVSSLNIYLRGTTSSGKVNLEDAIAGIEGDIEGLTLSAANNILKALEQQYKHTTATQGQQADNLLSVSVPFNSFQEWNYIKERITNTEGVQNIEIRQLSSQVALVDIIYSGDIQSLNKRLSREKLSLNDDGAQWSIQRLGENVPVENSPSNIPSQNNPSDGDLTRGEVEVQQLPPR